MRFTIKDVARHAAVSQTTVSLVLNGGRGVSGATRERVLRVMRELNYKPSTLARCLSASRAEAIAIVMPPWIEALEDSYFTQILRGVLEAVRDRGYKMLIEFADERFVQQKLWRDLFDRRRVDGLIFAMPFLDAEYLTEIDERGYPALLLNGVRQDLPCLHYAGHDDVRCGFDATDYLLGLAHRRIAYLAGARNQSSTEERLLGYRDALASARVPCLEQYVLNGDYNVESGKTMLQSILKRPRAEWPTALFCGNDHIARGAILAARDAGLCVPEDFSVVGVDDSAGASQFDPPLTTMRQDLHALGCIAAARFINKLETRGDQTTFSVRLPMTLVERDSCSRLDETRRQ